jgi:hypothetical protein
VFFPPALNPENRNPHDVTFPFVEEVTVYIPDRRERSDDDDDDDRWIGNCVFEQQQSGDHARDKHYTPRGMTVHWFAA